MWIWLALSLSRMVNGTFSLLLIASLAGEAIPLSEASTESCAHALVNQWITRFGLPSEILWSGITIHWGERNDCGIGFCVSRSRLQKRLIAGTSVWPSLHWVVFTTIIDSFVWSIKDREPYISALPYEDGFIMFTLYENGSIGFTDAVPFLLLP